MKRLILIAFLPLAACAHAPQEPVVDMRGVDPAKYQADLNECRGYANQVDAAGNGATDTAVGAVIGAAFGAAVGAVFHVPAAGAALGGASGALAGGTGGTGNSLRRQNTIEWNCMKNRGYTILG